jgi:hypothetical protein
MKRVVTEMAGDWIKVEVNTPDKPEILAVAGALNMDPDAVFGKCFRLWRWFDQQTENGNALGVTKSLLDRYLSAPNFCDALENVGWLHSENGDSTFSVTLPNFHRHNGETGKRRALTAKRKAKCISKGRERKGNATKVTCSLSYSSLKEGTLVPSELISSEFGDAWDQWVQHRIEIGKPLKPTQVKGQMDKLAKVGKARALAMMKHTIAMGWQGLREPDESDQEPASRVCWDAEGWQP